MTDVFTKLDIYAVNDAVCANAYESLSAIARGEIKQQIALLSALMPRVHGVSSYHQHLLSNTVTQQNKPVDIAIFLATCDWRYPQNIVPTILPAVLAGVETILPVFLTTQTNSIPSEHILAGLDLLGIDTVYALPASQVSVLHDITLSSFSRVVALEIVKELDEFLLCTFQNAVPCFACPAQAINVMWPILQPAWFTQTHYTID